MTQLIMAAQLILGLSILVTLHELGHFLAARAFGIKVEKFYLFFDAWGVKLFSFKRGDTEYGMGWLPLGGYVKIAGMIDESLDTDQLSTEPQPWEFRAKPAWQRLIVMVAGVTMNVILGIAIFSYSLLHFKQEYLPVTSVNNGEGIYAYRLGRELGLQNGDKIIAVNGDSVKYFNDIPSKLLLGKTVLLERDGRKMNIELPVNLIEQLVEKKGKRSELIVPRLPVIIGGFDDKDTSHAKKAGLKLFDRIVAVDSTTVGYFDEMGPLLNTKKGDSVSISFIRNMQPMQTKVLVDTNGHIGFGIVNEDQFDSLGILKQENTKYGLLAAFPAGVKKAGEKLDFYIQQFKLILNPKTGAYKGLGGFKAMASIFPKNEWNWEVFWNITAFFSIVLAFMNMLPIPALDGGHVLFTLIEMITGRKPSDKFLEYAQIAGMVLLFSLLIFANGNDWFGWGRGH